jgi:hypothetical protein
LKIKDGPTDEDDLEQSLKQLGKKKDEDNSGGGFFSFFTKHQENKRDESETMSVRKALFDQLG